MKHKLYTRLLSLALAVGLVIGMLPSAAAVDTVGDAGQPVTLGNGGEVSFTLPVKLYGDDGTDLSSAKTVNIPIVNGQTVQLPGEYTQGIETISSGDKTYNYDYVAAGFNGERINQLQAGLISTSTDDGVVIDSGGGIGDSWRILKYTTTYTYAVWYGNKPNSATSASVIATRSYTEEYKQRQKRFFGWYNDGDPYDYKTNPLQKQVDKKTIHFMYGKEGTLVPDKELTRDKIVTLNDDGTYDLTLTVSGAAGSITNPQKMDVLFIFDRSNSMNNYSRLTYVKTAAKSLVNTLQDNKAIDARYSIVTFSSKNDTNYGNGTADDSWYHLGWSEWKKTGSDYRPSNNIADSIDEISPWGGTNYQAGIRKGITQLNSCRPGAQKVVIFLTDGLPTYHIGGGNGQNDNYKENIGGAVQEIQGMKADAFYAIGVGSDFDNQWSTPVQNLNKLCNNVQANQTGLFTVGDNGSSSDLEKVFKDIAGDAVSILCSDVTVTDTLSENVEIVTSGSGTPVPNDFTITVENQNGQQVVTGKGSVQVDGVTITASYNAETRQIVLDFPDDYQLKKGYTYKVTTKIQATEAAYEAYRNNGNSYPNTGDKGTGTHAEQAGLYTNNKATVDYTYNGKNYSAEYPMPVIQLKPGTLTITKQITGDLENADITALKNKLTFTVNLNGTKSSYTLNQFTPGANNTYSLTIGGLSPNTEYAVTESGAEILGYVLDASSTGEKGTIAKGGTATAAFTNKYTPDTGSLTITKTVVGLDSTALAELKDKISFVVKDNSDKIVATINKDSKGWDTAWSENKFSYTLENLPTGTYTVTESGYNDITNYIWQPGDITATGTVVYNADGTTAALTNTYTPADGYLKIVKKIEGGEAFNDGRDTFTFKVTAQSGKDEGKVWYFTVKGEGLVVEKFKLPVGNYKVEELSNINYKSDYTVEGLNQDGVVTISNSNTETNPATVTFTNTPSKTDIPTDGGGVKNVAEIKEGQITWKQEPENDKKPTPEPTHD